MPTNLPALDEATRAKALEKAKETRRLRAEYMDKIRVGKIKAKQVLTKDIKDPIVKRIKVTSFLRAFNGIGPAHAAKIMNEAKITESRRLGGLGSRQIEKLLETLADV